MSIPTVAARRALDIDQGGTREVPDARLRRPVDRARGGARRDRDAGSRTTAPTRLLGNQLRPQEDAKVVRVRGGKPFVTDGPFAETKELIAGFDILECDSLDEAVAIAAKHPVAKFGAIDVREFYEFEHS